jgi:hypothetical protein
MLDSRQFIPKWSNLVENCPGPSALKGMASEGTLTTRSCGTQGVFIYLFRSLFSPSYLFFPSLLFLSLILPLSVSLFSLFSSSLISEKRGWKNF